MVLISFLKVYDWITAMSVETAYIEPGSPSQNAAVRALMPVFAMSR